MGFAVLDNVELMTSCLTKANLDPEHCVVGSLQVSTIVDVNKESGEGFIGNWGVGSSLIEGYMNFRLQMKIVFKLQAGINFTGRNYSDIDHYCKVVGETSSITDSTRNSSCYIAGSYFDCIGLENRYFALSSLVF